MVLCPNRHDNLDGLSHCRVCGLPLVDLRVAFASLAERLSSRSEMARSLPRALLIGLGTAGTGLIDVARATRGGSIPDCSYLAIDATETGPRAQSGGLPRLTLGGTTPNEATFCGIGETVVGDDPSIIPALRKAGISRPDGSQTLFLVSAIGGGIGSAASVVVGKCRQLNPACGLVGLAIAPGPDESFHNQLNAYFGLSRLLETPDSQTTDLIIAIQYDRVKKLRGVGPEGEELKTEGLLVALNDLLIKTLSSQNTAEIVRINRSMGIMLVVPCVALGRSLEIFGNLRNILESAIAFPVTNVRKEAVLACHLLLSVPNGLAADFPEEKVAEELRAVVKQHLPSVRSTSLSIFHGDEQHDRLDVCLLLGGDSATRALFADDVSLARFHQAMAGQTSWETYGLSEDRVRAAGDVLMHYDFALEKARGTSPSDGRRAGANGNKKSSGPRRGNGRAPGKATLRTDRV